MQFWFGMGVGNTLLAPIGFMSPGYDLAGVFATALAVGSFIVLGVVARVDERARTEFMGMVTAFRFTAQDDPKIQAKLDALEHAILNHGPLIRIAHDIGFLHGELVHRGLMQPHTMNKPESDV